MKTNQILHRELFVQRTKDSYFNATELLKLWNSNANNKRKEISKYKKNSSTIEFIDELKKRGIAKPYLSSNKGTWLHPYLFMDFAMWVSVSFKADVIACVMDGLIQSRHEAGDFYKEMCSAILGAYVDYYDRKPPAKAYIDEARIVRELVTEKKDRNEMTEQELKQITYLQKVNTSLIKKGIGKAARIKRLHEANEIQI